MLHVTATNLPRVMACNGSRRMAPSFPTIDGNRDDRDLGDAAHWVAKTVFDGVQTIEEINDRKAPNGVYITPEIIEHVTAYLGALEAGAMEVETTFEGSNFRVAGRADHIAFNADKTLFVDDFKYGWSLVEVERNWTLIAHAIGYCIRNSVTPTLIVMRIHQPRPHHRDGKLREWSITYPDLLELYGEIVAMLSNPSDTLNTGWQCRRCYANATCPAARAAELNAIDVVEHATFDETIPDDVLAYMLDTLETASATLENRLTALTELTKHRLITGAIIRDRALENRYGHRVWKPGYDAAMLQALTGKNLSKLGTATPAEAIRQGVDPDLVTMWTDRPSLGTKLIKADVNKRAAKLLKRSK